MLLQRQILVLNDAKSSHNEVLAFGSDAAFQITGKSEVLLMKLGYIDLLRLHKQELRLQVAFHCTFPSQRYEILDFPVFWNAADVGPHKLQEEYEDMTDFPLFWNAA